MVHVVPPLLIVKGNTKIRGGLQHVRWIKTCNIDMTGESLERVELFSSHYLKHSSFGLPESTYSYRHRYSFKGLTLPAPIMLSDKNLRDNTRNTALLPGCFDISQWVLSDNDMALGRIYPDSIYHNFRHTCVCLKMYRVKCLSKWPTLYAPVKIFVSSVHYGINL